MNIESRALRPIPLGLSFATFLAILYLGCLTLALIVPNSGLHAPWLQFLPGFVWTGAGMVIGFGESLAYGFIAGTIFAPIFNFYNGR
jgi:hypothetical protein